MYIPISGKIETISIYTGSPEAALEVNFDSCCAYPLFALCEYEEDGLLVFVEDLLDELPPPDVAAMIMAITINITMPIKHPGLLELDFDGALYEREGTFRLIDRSHC